MTPPYLGKAITPANTDLDLLAMTAQNANANAVTALALANQAIAGLGVFPVPNFGRTSTTLQQYISNSQTLWAGDYGVVGDGVADDTAAFRVALTAAAAAKRVLYCGAMTIKITAAVTGAGPGLVFDQASYGNAADPGILVSGAGYVALTWIGSPQAWRVNVYGTGNACDGICFGAPGGANILLGVLADTRVYNLAGFGVQINKCYDCLFGSISVELCGTAAAGKEAFQMLDDGDTCNMTTILRLQVDKATTQAINISPNSLCLNVNNIHSEGLISPDASKYAWILGGASSSFNGGRFQSGGAAADAKLWLRGAYSDYTAMRAESVTVLLEGVSGSGLTLISPQMTGTVSEYPAQSGALVIIGGSIAAWSGSVNNRYWANPVFGAWIDKLNVFTAALTIDALLTVNGDMMLGTAGNKVAVKQGANASFGRASLVGGTTVVATTLALTNGQEIFLSYMGVANVANTGRLYISAVTDGVSFAITSSNVADNSDVAWWIVGRA